MDASIRKSGIECLGDVRWGSHLCHFYETRQDLLEILAPFLKAGLEHNEYCLWVLPKGLDAAIALETLRDSVPDVDSYFRRGQLEFAGCADWYLTNGSFDPERVSRAGMDTLSRTRAAGYDGMRITGDAAWVGHNDWKAFQAYEEAANTAIGALPVIALCAYSRIDLRACEIIDVTKSHHGTIVKREGHWEFIENAAHRIACDYLRESEEKYRLLMQNSVDGIFIVDAEGGIVEVNRRAEELTGYSKAELEAMHFAHLHPPEYRATVTNAFRTGWERGSSEYTEIPLLKKNGETIVVDLAGAVFGCNGQKLGQAVVRDVTERRRTLDLLRQSEDYYRTIFENTGAATVMAEEDGTLSRANARFEELTGYTREEIEGRKKGFEFIHADDLEKVKAYHFLRRTNPDLAPSQYEFRAVDRKGTVKDVVLTICMIPGTKRSIGSLIDITDRKIVEQTLVVTERRFRSLLETVNLIAVMLDNEGNLVFCNDFLLRLTGWSRNEVAGKSWIDTFIPDDFRDELRRVFLGNAGWDMIPVHYENPIMTRQGERLLISWSNTVLQDARGNVIGLASIGSDITDRNRADAALRESEERFRQLAENIKEVFWMSDVEKNSLIYVSPAYEAVWGRSCRSLYENYEFFPDTVVPEDRHVLAAGFQKQRQGQTTDFEYRITRPDGSIRWIRSQSYPIPDKNGRPYRVAGISEDITVRKATEAKLLLFHHHLLSLTSKLSRTEDDERRRIATDLHDHIGQTLALAKIKLGELRGSTSAHGPDDALEEVRGLIDESIRYTRSLTYELCVPVLYELGLDAALEWLAEHMCEKHGLSVATEFQERADGFSDETRLLLYKSVHELLMNVVKHARTRAARLQVRRVDGCIRIAVEDDGAGYSASDDLLPGARGGYGLFSVRERLKRAGGSLQMDSAPGRGTRAVITMPYTPAAGDAPSTKEA